MNWNEIKALIKFSVIFMVTIYFILYVGTKI